MRLDTATALSVLYLLSELVLGLSKRADRSRATRADRGSLRLLWAIIPIAVWLGFSLKYAFSLGDFGAATPAAHALGILLFVLGLALRWYSIFYLGRFFTVDVAIAADHKVIDAGPYRYVRHPSYTGALLAFIGLGLVLANWASMLVMILPILGVFIRRIQVEESALLQGLGDAYQQYMQRTRRLVPGIY